MEHTVDQNFYVNVGFVCPLCRQNIQVPGDHLRQFHKISEEAMIQKLLDLDEFSMLTVMNHDQVKDEHGLGPSQRQQVPEIIDQVISTGCFRFECRHCGFVDDRDWIMENHLRDGHVGVVAEGDDLKRHLKLYRMEVHLQRIDGPGSFCRPTVDLFKPGDLVMAKCTGYPWWPGMILGCQTLETSHYRVLYFNASKTTTAIVAGDKVKSYDEFDDYFSSFGKKKISWREVRPSIGY